MTVISPHFSQLLPFSPSLPSCRISLSRTRVYCSMDSLRTKFMEFPHVSGPHRDLMVELVSSVETRLGSSLQPCTLPPDVQFFANPNGSAQACIQLRSGQPSSQVDLVLGSWNHFKLPSGGALNITSLSAYLKPSTNAPHFTLELIRSSPTSLVLFLDLTPRKDLILYTDYLKTFYEDTQLDKHREKLQKLPEVSPYVSPSLYIRALLSPTAILVRINTESSETTLDDIIRDEVSPIAKEMLQFWLDTCACMERQVQDTEGSYLAQRDLVIKGTTIEVDLGSSFPRLFGEEVASRVLDVLRECYKS